MRLAALTLIAIVCGCGENGPRDRSLLWLAYVEGCSHREIAEVMGIKPASVKVLLSRARERLAPMLQRGGYAA